jgi:hypothetical protein
VLWLDEDEELELNELLLDEDELELLELELEEDELELKELELELELEDVPASMTLGVRAYQ